MFLSMVPSSAIELLFRQQPHEALVVAKGKEKGRKPVDPPPVIELRVKRSTDSQQMFIQSPYISLIATLWKADEDEPMPGDSLIGVRTVSISPFKDYNSQYAGTFVFGEMSVGVLGTYRIHFTMVEFNLVEQCFQQVGSITSDKFNVVAPKDFTGMDDSTFITRSLAEQGVRLRLRKEPRAVAGSKRKHQHDSPISITPARPATTYEEAFTPVRTTPSYDRSYMNMYNTPAYHGNYHSTPSLGNIGSMAGMAGMNAMTANASLSHNHNMATNHSMTADHSMAALTPTMAPNPGLATMATMATNANLPTMATNPNLGSMNSLGNMPGMFFSDFDYHQR
jgi:hypothetical protein